MKYLVTANVNVSDDAIRRRHYAPGDPVATVGYYDVEAATHLDAAQAVYDIGNRAAADLDGKTWPSDVADTDSVAKILAVEPRGFAEVEQPTNRCQVMLGGQELHTSRPAPLVLCSYPGHGGIHQATPLCQHPYQGV
jgi:hypothetical protein